MNSAPSSSLSTLSSEDQEHSQEDNGIGSSTANQDVASPATYTQSPAAEKRRRMEELAELRRQKRRRG